jgi:hypothetical protein
MKLAATLLLILLLNVTRAFCQGTTQGDGLNINLRMETPQPVFGLKDSVVLDFEIINSGSKPVGMFAKLGMGYQGGVILHVLDKTGAEVEPPTLAHDSLDLEGIREAKNYFDLQPHQFLGTRQIFAVSELVTKPGRYRLLAEYHSPVDSKYAKVGNFWGIERKSVVSTELEFNVE